MKTYSYQQLAACARRELWLRKQVYPKQVSRMKMAQTKADTEIAQMDAITEHFEKLAEQERLL